MSRERYEGMIRALEHNLFKVAFFDTAEAAAEYIAGSIHGTTVGLGDSATLESMNIAELLSRDNTVIDPRHYSGTEFIEVAKRALTADIYLTSVNGASETGELVNIDSTGNRVAASLFGHRRVFFVFGTNKIEPTLERAIWRARNIAAPRNARRFGFKTPCAVKGDRCYDCASPDRICNALTIYLRRMKNVESEVVMIDEELGL
ncbi:MAG: lactate utilization protein [Fretibacterium sp.]|nr:lactate utilization protein [Fretibacterium sp.]